jgi:hypothetical protein
LLTRKFIRNRCAALESCQGRAPIVVAEALPVDALEHHEKIEHAGQHHGNKAIAVLIMMLAALLAICEMGGKNAQHMSLASNIEAANLWAFFQAKTIRMTTLRTAAEAVETIAADLPQSGASAQKQLVKWRATAQRYDTEPETGEGRQELAARAKAAEEKRDRALSAYHNFEYGSAALQLAIVLASASLVTGMMLLAYVSGGLGLIGVALAFFGWFAPGVLHL